MNLRARSGAAVVTAPLPPVTDPLPQPGFDAHGEACAWGLGYLSKAALEFLAGDITEAELRQAVHQANLPVTLAMRGLDTPAGAGDLVEAFRG